MTHLGTAELPVLVAIVTGAMAFTFAVTDYVLFGRSAYGLEIGSLAVIMGLFTTYHVALILDHNLGGTTNLFGEILETVIALVAVVIIGRNYLERHRLEE